MFPLRSRMTAMGSEENISLVTFRSRFLDSEMNCALGMV